MYLTVTMAFMLYLVLELATEKTPPWGLRSWVTQTLAKSA